ncbi:MAG: hypothetical protein ACI9MC_002571 [Kiritimatiellia bacterium]|jgi:hypothetical protein
MVVCETCNSEVQLDGDEALAIGKRPGHAPPFDLAIEDAVTWEGVRYEVAARLAYQEDDDRIFTMQYMLFNPRRGTVWLEHYGREWNISTTSHARLQLYPFSATVNKSYRSLDGKKWKCVEKGTMYLKYVDGALPWVARRGERVRYVDLSGPNRAELQATLSDSDELELSVGQALTPHQVRQITGNSRILVSVPPEPKGKVIGRGASAIVLIAVALLISVVVIVQTTGQGRRALQDDFPLHRLTDANGGPVEVYTQAFDVAEDGNLVEVRVRSPDLDNAWMSLDVAFVRDDTVVHVSDVDLSYYHGYEGGESWSEGSRESSKVVLVPKAGRYKLLLRSRSARGNAERSSAPQHTFRLTVIDGVAQSGWAMWSAIVLLVALIGFTLLTFTAAKEAR